MARTDFGKAIERFAEKVDGGIATVMRKSSVDLLSAIVMRTPVGNPDLWKSSPPPGYVGGRLRASWTVDFGQPEIAFDIRPDPAGNATVSRGELKLQQWQPGLPIVISTRLPYAPRIEFQGHSGQAPAGMVRVSVAEWHSFIERAARSLD